MFFFNRNKLKVKSENIENDLKVTVGYYNLQSQRDFRSAFLKDIIGSNKALSVLNTRLIQREPGSEEVINIDDILNLLEESKIQYEKITFKPDEDVSIMGLNIKMDAKKRKKDHMIGFVIDRD